MPDSPEDLRLAHEQALKDMRAIERGVDTEELAMH